MHANLQQSTNNFRRMYYDEMCNKFHLTDPKHRTAFTFVREPISRFISGYEEIEYQSRSGEDWPQYDSLAKVLKTKAVPCQRQLIDLPI